MVDIDQVVIKAGQAEQRKGLFIMRSHTGFDMDTSSMEHRDLW